MTAHVDLQWPWLVLLCSLRLVPVLLLTPVLSSFGFPAKAKALLVIGLGAAMASTAAGPAPVVATDALGLAVMSATEFATGWVISLGVHLAFGAISLAGRLLDMQSGFSLGSFFDPLTKRPASPFESALAVLAVVVFVAGDAHLGMLRLLADSFTAVPVGNAMLEVDPIALTRKASLMFSQGVAFAAPVVLLLLLFDFGLAAMSRSVPQLSVVFLVVGIKLSIALLLLAALASSWGSPFRRIFAFISI